MLNVQVVVEDGEGVPGPHRWWWLVQADGADDDTQDRRLTFSGAAPTPDDAHAAADDCKGRADAAWATVFRDRG